MLITISLHDRLQIATRQTTFKSENYELVMVYFIGAVAGWLAGKIMRGGGFGLLINLVVGIVGGVIGGWVFGLLGIGPDGSIIGSLVTSLVGAILLLWLISLFKKV